MTPIPTPILPLSLMLVVIVKRDTVIYTVKGDLQLRAGRKVRLEGVTPRPPPNEYPPGALGF